MLRELVVLQRNAAGSYPALLGLPDARVVVSSRIRRYQSYISGVITAPETPDPRSLACSQRGEEATLVKGSSRGVVVWTQVASWPLLPEEPCREDDDTVQKEASRGPGVDVDGQTKCRNINQH